MVEHWASERAEVVNSFSVNVRLTPIKQNLKASIKDMDFRTRGDVVNEMGVFAHWILGGSSDSL